MPLTLMISFAVITALIIFLALFLLIISIITMLFTGVPYAGTPRHMLKEILEKLDIQPGQVLYDLGCGDGRVLFAAENRGAKAKGFEISLPVYLRARVSKIFYGSKAKIYFKNFYYADLSDADVVFCFLVGKVMERVEKKLDKELKPGSKVVSYGFSLPNWTPQKTILPDLKKDKTTSRVFIYEKK